jgi:hypothetical protein
MNREQRRQQRKVARMKPELRAGAPSSDPLVAARNLRQIADKTDAEIASIEEQIAAFEGALESLRGMVAAAEAMRDSYRQAADALERNNAA